MYMFKSICVVFSHTHTRTHGIQQGSLDEEPRPDEFLETRWTYPGTLCCAAYASSHLPGTRSDIVS